LTEIVATGREPSAIGTGCSERAVDLVHLARMTLGDREVEREVLDLFVRQIDSLLAGLDSNAPASAGLLAHRMKGSARGVGAWAVAAAAEIVEDAASSRPEALPKAVAGLARRSQEAKTVIEDLLRSH
jgi:HPt (histidine-containing phosphotransfer) domain-containing protein